MNFSTLSLSQKFGKYFTITVKNSWKIGAENNVCIAFNELL